MFLRVFDGVGGGGVVNPMHTLNLSGEREGEKNGKEKVPAIIIEHNV